MSTSHYDQRKDIYFITVTGSEIRDAFSDPDKYREFIYNTFGIRISPRKEGDIDKNDLSD